MVVPALKGNIIFVAKGIYCEDYYRKIAPLIACLKSVYNILLKGARK